MHIYDYIIIGSGLTGLSIAQKISEETKNILILEAHDMPGGDNKSAKLNGHTINNGLRYYPRSPLSLKSLEFLGGLLNKNLFQDVIENNPETYEASGFKRFLGFGDNHIDFYDQLSYFLSQEEIVLSEQPYSWIESLQNNLKDFIQTKSIVTRFGFSELTNEKNPDLTHVIINGTKQLFAKNFIFTGPVKELNLLLPDEILNARSKAKLKKSQAWQAVCLDLFHLSTYDKQNLFVLNGTTNDELGPCVGRFLNGIQNENQEPMGQISQWLSFVDTESAEDTENIGLVLKKMKRQIKRAFPNIADSVKKERIFVTPALSGCDLKLSANFTLPKVQNLWIASPQASQSKNLLASLQQAQIILASLGFQTNLDINDLQSETKLAEVED